MTRITKSKKKKRSSDLKIAGYDNTTDRYSEQKRKNLIKKLKERGFTPEQIKQHPQLKKA